MMPSKKIIVFHLLLTFCTVYCAPPKDVKVIRKSAPLSDSDNEFADGNVRKIKDVEKGLEKILSYYYDTFIKDTNREPHFLAANEVLNEKQSKVAKSVDIYDTMQGDQPVLNEENSIHHLPSGNISHSEHVRIMRNRTKDHWIQILKENILKQIGRSNVTISKPGEPMLSPMNITEIFPHFFNGTTIEDDHITEKIRSYYPSCEMPSNTDQELWNDDNIMNLYFNYTSDDHATRIATATLRLYRIPLTNATSITNNADCDHSGVSDDDKLIRISIYWYTKSLRKKRTKRRLCDSKVVSENAKWVELSVKPATKAWTKGKNLGLAVVVEDQEGNTLKADKYFKGATCSVGMSTPRPIPTILVDASRQTNELYNLLGRNATSPISSDVFLLPTIDICTLEFHHNYTNITNISQLRINACNLRKIHEQRQKSIEKERLERLATLSDIVWPTNRHIRHHRQHMSGKSGEGSHFDPRQKFTGQKIIIPNHQSANFTFTDR